MKLLALALAAAGLLCLAEARPGLSSETTEELIRALEMLESLEETKHHPEVAKHLITSKKVDAQPIIPLLIAPVIPFPPVIPIRPINLIMPTEDVGWFASDNFGMGDYLPDIEDKWVLVGLPSKALKLTFNAFNLDNNHDKVTIFDGSDANATILDELTGDMSNSIPYVVTSSIGEGMTVVMTTDSSVAGPGFNATYELIGGNAGDIEVVAEEFTFSTPLPPRPIQIFLPIEDKVEWFASQNFGNGDYLPNLEDTWIIFNPSGKTLKLTFNAFNLENNHDKVTIYDGQDKNATILDELTGDMSNSIPYVVTSSNGEGMMLVMTTDSNEQGPGFNVTYELIDGATAGSNADGKDGGKAGGNTVEAEGDFAAECVYAHNNVRRRHGVGDLTWDSDIAAGAQVWAEYLRDNDPKQPHDPANNYGENIAKRGVPFADSLFECADSVFAWYDEVHEYDFNAPGFGMSTGHFTAVVWESTTKVGCGTAVTADYSAQWTVCRYDPPGNMNPASNFVDNVSQLSSGQSYPTSQRDLEEGPCHDKTSTTSCNQVVSWGLCDQADEGTDAYRIVCWSTCGKC